MVWTAGFEVLPIDGRRLSTEEFRHYSPPSYMIMCDGGAEMGAKIASAFLFTYLLY